MPWMQRSLKAHLANGLLPRDPLDLDWLDLSEEDEEEDEEEEQEGDQDEVPVAARVRATYLIPQLYIDIYMHARTMHAWVRCMGEGTG